MLLTDYLYDIIKAYDALKIWLFGFEYYYSRVSHVIESVFDWKNLCDNQVEFVNYVHYF